MDFKGTNGPMLRSWSPALGTRRLEPKHVVLPLVITATHNLTLRPFGQTGPVAPGHFTKMFFLGEKLVNQNT